MCLTDSRSEPWSTVSWAVGPSCSSADEHERRVDADALPRDAGEGAWLLVRSHGNTVEVLGVDHAGAAAAQEALDARIDRIRRDRGGGRFGR